MASTVETKIKGCLHVEVRMKDCDGAFVRTDTIRDAVSEWLASNFSHLEVSQQLKGYDELPHASLIHSIQVVEFSGKETDSVSHKLHDIRLDVQAYELHDGGELQRFQSENESDELVLHFLRVCQLPNKNFEGLWDNLIFDDAIAPRLLHFASRMMSLMRHPAMGSPFTNWNRLLLLHGPPGSGKSTLCRALAQKLAIRLGNHFTQSKFIEVASHSLLSKWFGESAKLVDTMFQQIFTIASDESTLVCVLIDEVESLAGSREKAVSGNEVADALRVTNQLLTALDKLRHKSNVMVFCTTNLLSAMDSAFLDRVDVIQQIRNPSTEATYEIFRSTFNELIRCGVLTQGEALEEGRSVQVDSNLDTVLADDSDILMKADSENLSKNACAPELPSIFKVNVELWDQPQLQGPKLQKIAEMAAGRSGRTLRRLPTIAIALHTYGDHCTVDEALEALSLEVTAQKPVV